MKLSVLLPELLPQYAFRVENEQEFSTLGLVVSPVEEPFCTFVENEKALYTIGDNAVMVITTPANRANWHWTRLRYTKHGNHTFQNKMQQTYKPIRTTINNYNK